MPDGQNGVLDFWNWGVNDDAVSVAPLPPFERPAYVLNNRKWGSALTGTSGGTITWAVVTAGQTYPSTQYTSSAAAITSTFIPTIRSAFERWDGVGNFSFVESTNPMTADIVVVFDELSGQGSGVLGLAYTYSRSGVISNSYISFDLNRRYMLPDGSVHTVGTASSSSTAFNFYVLALHEIGHALGLGHEDDFTTVMTSYLSPTISDLSSDEIAGIQQLYGGGSTVPTSDDYAASTSTAGLIAVGGSASGNIEVGDDRDWFRVTLTAGVSYRIDLIGGTLADPLVYLRNSNGTALSYDDDSGSGLNALLTYTPSTSGVYFIDAQGATYSGTGTYTLSITATSQADDYGNNVLTLGALTVGGSATGTFENNQDADWFRVTLTAGQTYRIDARGAASGGGTMLDPSLSIYTSAGSLTRFDTDSGTGADAQIIFTPTTSGTYYIAPEALFAGTGTYTVSIANISPVDDYSGSTATTGILVPAASVTGNIETGGDRDWFRVTLTAGSIYTFDLRGIDTAGGSLSDPYLTLRNASGTRLASDDDSGTVLDARLTYTALTSGTYYIEARSSSSSGTGTYTLGLSATTPGPVDDYPGTSATTATATIAVGVTRTGNIEVPTDQDWFRISLSAGTTYYFDIRGASTGAGTISRPAAFLQTPTTGFAGFDSWGGYGNDARIAYTPTASGTHYLYVIPGGAATFGTYSVLVSTNPTDDFAETTATTGTVSVGGTRTGNIEVAGDHDRFGVALDAGVSYQIDVRGAPGGGGTLANTALVMYAANDFTASLSTGALGFTTDSGGAGADARLIFTPTSTGTYFVEAFSGTYSGTGTYTVAVSRADDFPASTATTGSIKAGGAATGTLEVGGDRDWLRIDVAAGLTYRIDVQGADSGAGTLANPFATLLDSRGLFVNTDDDGGVGRDAQLTFTALATGAYYIAVSGFVSSETGTYTVNVSLSNEDEYTATTATSGLVTTTTAGVGNIGQAGDVDWLKMSLTAGVLYQIDGRGLSSAGATLTNPHLTLLNSAGTALAADNNSGLADEARIYYRAPTTGTYYVAMRSSSATETGTYTVNLVANPDDYAATASTTGTLAVGTSVDAVVETAGDRDWFRTTLVAGRTYNIDLQATAAGSGLRWAESSMFIRNGGGGVVGSATRGSLGGGVRLTYTPATTGTYFIDALAYTVGVGSYTISLAAAEADQAPGIAQEPDASLSDAELAAITQPPAIGLWDLPEEIGVSPSRAPSLRWQSAEDNPTISDNALALGAIPGFPNPIHVPQGHALDLLAAAAF